MSGSSENKPLLRPVEAIPIDQDGQQLILIQDPRGLASGPIVVSPAALYLFSFMDGEHEIEEIARAFEEQFGQTVPLEQLRDMVQQMDVALFLDNERFAQHRLSLIEAYRSSPVRTSSDAESFGADEDGLGPTIQRMLAEGGSAARETDGSRRLVGLVAPHLDYPRGAGCYAEAYNLFAREVMSRMERPTRYVILGTNHFGEGSSVVATGKDFQTPLGTTRTDTAFVKALSDACGYDLCMHEFDHQREHSIELQVLILQQLLGPEAFEIVPILCHDPCGPTGTAPYDGEGVDLRAFADVLRRVIEQDDRRTFLIAGADLSHVGTRFGDDHDLSRAFLGEVEALDRKALDAVVAGDPDGFVQLLAEQENRTRICSAGSIFALANVLGDAKAELLLYEQAVDEEQTTGVTCSAMAFWALC